MKKFLTTALMVVFGAFVLTTKQAELVLSGYQSSHAVSVDQSTAAGLQQDTQTDNARSGLSNGRFTCLIATEQAQFDSGIAVTAF